MMKSPQPTRVQAVPPPNQQAHLVLTQLIERVGFTRRSFLNRLADLGYSFSDDDFVNWGRSGRSFPRTWPAVAAMIEVVTHAHPPARRCTAQEALHFLSLVGMPFSELHTIAALYPNAEFTAALETYLPAVAPAISVQAPPTATNHGESHAGHVIDGGLWALTELMRSPGITQAMLSFRIDFENICRQIGILSDYKHLHDLFQQLDDRFYLLYHDGKRVPNDPTAWASIERIVPEVCIIADDLLNYAGHAAVATIVALWRDKLALICQELEEARAHRDALMLQRATRRLKDLLGREPSRINTCLVSAAHTLQLSALVHALCAVRDGLKQRNLDALGLRQVAEFEQGIAALAQVGERLPQMIITHNAFQQIDDELRRCEALLDQDVQELIYSWQHLQPLTRHLCRDNASAWASKLRTLADKLECVIPDHSHNEIISVFRSYRSQALRAFNQVDHDLLTLCKELQRVGAPLDTILRMLA